MSARLGKILNPTGDAIGRAVVDLEREPGFGWKLSPEAAREIEEMEHANAVAVARLLARGVGARSMKKAVSR